MKVIKSHIWPSRDLSWRFFNPVKICFGTGVRTQVVDALSGERFALVCTPRGRQRLFNDSAFITLICNPKLVWADFVEANPDIDRVQTFIDNLRVARVKAIIAIGGGSVIDTAKALSVGLVSNENNLRQLIAESQILERLKALPLFTVPTTAGTGSEVTPFATLWDYSQGMKLSLEGPNLYPKIAFVDPISTLELSKENIITTGLDAINQSAESIWNRNANPITVELAIRALDLGLSALHKLVQSPTSQEAHRDMMECSLLAGLAISQTKTALCHSISYPLTINYGIPHGLACAFSMAAVAHFNSEKDDGRILYAAQSLGFDKVESLIQHIETILRSVRFADRISNYFKCRTKEIGSLVSKMDDLKRSKNNLRQPDQDNIRMIVSKSWQEYVKINS